MRAIAQLAIAERSAVATIAQASAQAQLVVQRATERQQRLQSAMHDMLEALYQNDRYNEAIRIADDFIVRAGEPESFIFWLHYAAAQGQRATHAGRERP